MAPCSCTPLALVLTGILSAWAQDGCPPGFSSNTDGCFYVSNTEATWAGALGYCNIEHGHLAYIETVEQQTLLANYLKQHYNESSIHVTTANDYHYHYLHDLGMDVTGHTSFTFNVKACHDAHIALSQDKGVDSRNTYEIVIGGWSDQQSVIRDCKQCAHMDTQNRIPHPLSCSQYRPFWVSWANNIIRVGHGNIVGKSQFMMWNDTAPHEVNYVAVATGFGSSGEWDITVGNYWPGQFWLGLSDLAVEGEWTWLPQQGSLNYANWGPGEPDNALNREHCALIDIHRNFTWSDDNCEERRNFICQVDL